MALPLFFLFISPLLISGQSIPDPEKILGFEIGADYHLALFG
jgi:hypothetical protein